MSLYYCSITNEAAEVPVVSTKSGHIYERRIIEKYINANQNCPITNQPLTSEDIVEIQVQNTIKPRPVNETGVSDLITIFQNEYDALIFEAHNLKQNVESVRQELSQTLYQHDAACRVIERLIQERDEANAELEEFIQARQGMEEEITEGGLPEEVIAQINERKAELNSMRKDRRKNKEVIGRFASQEMISGYRLANSLPLHSTTKPGITALDIHQDQDDFLITGGNDGAVIFYNKQNNRIINSYTKHHKKITDVKFVPRKGGDSNNVLSIVSCEDGRGNLLTNNLETGELGVAYFVDTHKHALVGCAVHPLSYIGIFACKDGSFSYHDLAQGRLLSYVAQDGYHLRNIKIHPDGHIAALAGHDGTIRIWDIMGQSQVAEIKAHNGGIDSLNFSENGINFATGSHADKTVKLWDLRNLNDDNFKIVEQNAGGAVTFDQFGQFLAVGTNSVRLYNVKDLQEFGRLDGHKDSITSVQFGSYSRYVATVSLDRHLNIYA